MRINRLTILLLPLVVLAVAACGSSSSGSSTSAAAAASSTSPASTSSSSAAAPAAGGQVLTVAANPKGDLMFDKMTLTAKTGKVTIDFTNASSVPHNLSLQPGTSGPNIAATPTFSGGMKSFTVTLKAGKYTYYCSVPGHRAAGMMGTLTVS